MANQVSVNTGSGAGAQQVIVDSNGNISVTVSRSVIGTVANVASANYANFAGTVVTAAQPNITSVGNLTNLNVTGTTTTGNLVVLGNLQVGNLVANTANYANFAGNAFAVAGANVSGTVANAAYADNAGNANFANTATVANSANSVTLANVSGAGNIASINLDGNVSNVLKGDGTFGPEGSTGNANYANFAGNAFSVDGSNVVGAVANATFALDAGNANIANIAYSVDGANVSGTVANATFALDAGNANIANIAYSVDAANVSGLGNIAVINLDGNASNFLDGTGNFVAAPTSANANYANFAGTVLTNAQPNITSTGTLTVLNANTSTPISITSSNGNIAFRTVNSANTAGRRVEFAYENPVTFNQAILGADEAGFGYYISNTAPGNVGTGNIRSYWQFLTNGDFRHTVGGSGNVIAKNLLLGNVFTGQFNGNIIAGNGSLGIGNVTSVGIFTGNAAGLTNIPGANVTGTVANATYAANSGNANIANIAYSVDGANVNGTVANATFALDAGNANIANIAYSVDGANVSGTVANATFALDAGNANIANTAYSVDVANVVGIGNIATINLDGNVANALLGDGTFGAVELTTANYANFAGTVLTNAQPNITSVGTLTGLTVSSNANVVAEAINNFAILKVTANANGFGAQQLYNGTHIQQSTQAGAADTGFTITTSNTAPGNAFPSNLKGVWRFDTTGNLAHLIGGTGAIVAKQGVFGTGNVSAGNMTATSNVNANNVIVTNNIQSNNANVNNINSTGTLSLSTNGITNGIQITGRQISLNGANTGAGNVSRIDLNNGALVWNLDNTVLSGLPPFGMNRYNNGFLDPLNYYTARGNAASPADAQVGDALFTERVQTRYDNNFKDVWSADVRVESFSPSNDVAIQYNFDALSDQANSVMRLGFGTANVLGNLNAAGNINVASGNVVLDTTGNITATGRLDYLRTYGSFTSNATQTSNGANTVNFMTFNNDEGSNGVSVVSNSQLTIARTGIYNIQFSAELIHDTNQTANIEIWLTKNGSAVANSAGRVLLIKDEAKVVSWNYVDNASTANTYYQLAWASPDTNVELLAIDSANTISGVAIPSVIVTVTPVGA